MAVARSARVPLESADHLTREEFHRRYLARPDIVKAELVGEIVYVASPVSAARGQPDNAVNGWRYAYIARVPGVAAFTNTTVFLPDGSEVQPDALLIHAAPHGLARVSDQGYIEGAPELVVEVAVSGAAHDLHSKKDAYERSGVPECIVWQISDRRIDWFALRDGRYVRLEPDAAGVIESRVFPGLRLAIAKMLVGDHAGVLAELENRVR